MKQLLILSAFMLAALIKANNFNFKNEKTAQAVLFTRYLITLKTVC